jgi:hypothetical protein
MPVALRVGEIGLLTHNLSERLFIFYPTRGYGPPLGPEIGGKTAGPTIPRLKPIGARLLCSATWCSRFCHVGAV